MESSDGRLDPEICRDCNIIGQEVQWNSGSECHEERALLSQGSNKGLLFTKQNKNNKRIEQPTSQILRIEYIPEVVEGRRDVSSTHR